MKLGDTRYISVKQVKKDGKVAGILTLTGHAWGFKVLLHYFDTPGYKIDETFQSESKARAFFDKTYKEDKANG